MNENIPKKSLGQHWLNDVDSLDAMADIADVQAGDNILEIGPGLGTLTEVLLAYGASVVAVEYDLKLYEELKREAENMFVDDAKRLKVVYGDILQFDFGTLPAGYKVVANIPYYLTSNLVRVLSEAANPPASATLLVQKEVAERLAAGPGDMSLLTVSAGMYFEPSLGPIVPAKLFTPPPKVDSRIIHLNRRQVPLFGDLDEKLLFRVVKAGFSNRRKTILNSLSAGFQLTKEQTSELLQSVGIDPQSRSQELSLEQWILLAKSMPVVA
jgi:16S rRNA (adenine1518-N6/adenine1519-N6)-dimethyltransferase